MTKYLKSFFTIMSLVLMLLVVGTVNVKAATVTVTDTITASMLEATSTSYKDFSDVTSESDAVYAGNSAKSNSGDIQLRSSNSNSGIVTTASGGKIKKITLEWASNTSTGRTIDVYGKNTAYTQATDLYSASTQGTKIGSIVCGTGTILEITTDYEFVGLRSNSGALYLAKVTIDWETTSSATTYDVTFNYNNGSEADTVTVEENSTVDQPTNITKPGYRLEGWYTDSSLTNKYNFSSPVTASFDLYANWVAVSQYTVTFDSNGGSTINPVVLNEGDILTKPTNPTKSGYSFVNWYNGNNVYDFSQPVTTNLTLRAEWVEFGIVEKAGVKYSMVTSSSEVTDGNYIIGSTKTDGSSIYMGAVSGSYFSAVDSVDSALVWSFISTGDGAFYVKNSDKFLQCSTAASGSNYAYLKEDVTDGIKWTVGTLSEEDNSDYTFFEFFTQYGSNSSRYLSYNRTSPRFSTYVNTAQAEIILFKEVVAEPEVDLRETEAAIQCQYNVAETEEGYNKLRILTTVYTEDTTVANVESILITLTYGGQTSKAINIYTLYTSVSASGSPILTQEANHYYGILVLSNADKYDGEEFVITMNITYTDGTVVSVEKTITMGIVG